VNRDIAVKCQLSPEEYIALVHMADDSGLSQSAFIRQLIKRETANHAVRVLAMREIDSTKTAQD
jgi:hypothetical protein